MVRVAGRQTGTLFRCGRMAGRLMAEWPHPTKVQTIKRRTSSPQTPLSRRNVRSKANHRPQTHPKEKSQAGVA
uniref:Uncharacterized protein ORF SG106 n=1 Tax=Pseudomonas aeruginosa TaxID=287 RepID=Q8GPP7_PSEAI|nr:hypothetical protein [Pseudomonas aeruginosa]